MSFDKEPFLEKAAAITGATQVFVDAPDVDVYQQDWRGRYRGGAFAVVLPGNANEVAALVRLCSENKVAVIPQAGNTGLTGGAIAPLDRPAIIANVSRLNTIREIDPRNNSLVAEAGCILANVRESADQNGRLFPMLLGSVGSCEIGGLVSTNAGGTGVLRYGNMRDLTLGLEVVLPDGTIWHGLRGLRKDNAGYDLKQLFIGAEGTLGIVTAAVLKLFPKPRASASAMVALSSVEKAVDLLRFTQERLGNRIEAFEIMSKEQIDIVLSFGHVASSPIENRYPWYVLIELADSAMDWRPHDELENAMAAALEAGLIADAVIAANEAKANRIWELRHTISESNKRAGFTISNDTSVPISRLPGFIASVTARLSSEIPSARICHAGHVGDGNIHVVIILSRDAYKTVEACEGMAAKANLIVHEESVACDGSISAEHGIGLMHVERLKKFKPRVDMEMMRTIKQAFDPDKIMNPGKILSAE